MPLKICKKILPFKKSKQTHDVLIATDVKTGPNLKQNSLSTWKGPRYFLKDRIRLSGRISSPLLYYSITMAKTDRPSFFWWYSKSYCIWGICNTRPYTSVFGTISPNLSEGARKYFDYRMLIYYKDQYDVLTSTWGFAMMLRVETCFVRIYLSKDQNLTNSK